MSQHRILAALAGAALASVPAGQYAAGRAIPDLQTLQGAPCSAPAGAAPALLVRLVQAQTETRPFQPGQQLPAPVDPAPPPLYNNLGKLHMAVTTRHPKAQAYFDQGLRLAFAFNHAEAARAFRAAQRLDPHCAMCHWGEALVLGPNINAPMFPDAVAPAHAAAARAQHLAGRAGPREQALIRAIVQRYADAPLDDRWTAPMPTPCAKRRSPFPPTTISRYCTPRR